MSHMLRSLKLEPWDARALCRVLGEPVGFHGESRVKTAHSSTSKGNLFLLLVTRGSRGLGSHRTVVWVGVAPDARWADALLSLIHKSRQPPPLCRRMYNASGKC